MERGAKLDLSAVKIIGAVYTILGSVFSVLGGAFLYFADEADLYILGSVFTALGSVFLILGVIFLVAEGLRKKRVDALITGRRCIWAEVCDIVPNYNVRVNGRSPVVFVARYTDGSGREHLFRSHNIRYYRDERLLGRQIRIYIRDEGYKPYYMDVEALLPDTVEHYNCFPGKGFSRTNH